MAFKKVPVEMLLEIARFIRFHRRWAHVRVSHAFDQLLLESMADFLRHAQALALDCLSAFGILLIVMPQMSREWIHCGQKVDPGIGLMYDWPNYYATKHIETILKKVGKILHRLLRSDDTTVAHLNSMARDLKGYIEISLSRIEMEAQVSAINARRVLMRL
ncbi:hypothetical protein GPALN_003391 [Globodera pallida]|nr:hypothetical protein GPALN_003391 [Globodera pallida]